MSVSRPHIWTCNMCNKIEHKQGYGMPAGWDWYGGTVSEPEVKHKCKECQEATK